MMQTTVLMIIFLVASAWLCCLTVGALGVGFLFYQHIRKMREAQHWDRLLWFGLGFATNIFFPLVRPVYPERENDGHSTAATSESANTSGVPTASDVRSPTVPQFTATPVSGQELQELLNLFSGSAATIPLTSIPVRRTNRTEST